MPQKSQSVKRIWTADCFELLAGEFIQKSKISLAKEVKKKVKFKVIKHISPINSYSPLEHNFQGTWVVQLVGHLTLGFHAGHGFGVVR